ncbi:MAG: lamin tail domain-containing protein [Candidatus Eisenbacteria bacterium]
MRFMHSLFVLVLFAVTALAGVATGAVRLNEILAGPARDWDGSGVFSSRDDEWVEIANTGPVAVDLAGFFLTDADSVRRYAFTGSLAPGEIRIVTGKMSYDWEHLTGFSAVGLSLGNSGDRVVLWRSTGTDSLIVDAYTFRSHEAAADRSIGRDVATGEWQLFDSLNPYTGTLTTQGNHCPPSPGAANVCGGTPVTPTTWGRLKTPRR